MRCSYQPVGTIKRNPKQVELYKWFSVLSRLLCSYNIDQSVVTINNNLKRAKTKQPFFFNHVCFIHLNSSIERSFQPVGTITTTIFAKFYEQLRFFHVCLVPIR